MILILAMTERMNRGFEDVGSYSMMKRIRSKSFFAMGNHHISSTADWIDMIDIELTSL